MTQFANENQLIESVAMARQFDFEELQRLLNESYRATRYRDAYHVDLEVGEAWIFSYGVVIFWGVAESLKDRLLTSLIEVMEDPFEQHEEERFTFTFGEDVQMREEKISLKEGSHYERLAASHALAQSSKLGHFEGMARGVIVENEYIPRQLATSGKTSLSRKELAKLRGTLFSVKSDIMLNFNLLDTPEFFWNYPELEPIYHVVEKYLDVTSRVNVLSKKLETIHELLDMLANEQNHKHSSILEWIIIALIALEVVLFFVH